MHSSNTCCLAPYWLEKVDGTEEHLHQPIRTWETRNEISLLLALPINVWYINACVLQIPEITVRVMAKTQAVLLLIATIFLLSSLIPVSYCAKKPVAVARKEDIPFIKCQVCEKLAYQLYQQVQKKQAQISPKKVILSSFCLLTLL